MRSNNHIPVKNLDKNQYPYVSPGSARNWHSKGIHPLVVYRVPNKGLVFNMEEWEKVCESSKPNRKGSGDEKEK